MKKVMKVNIFNPKKIMDLIFMKIYYLHQKNLRQINPKLVKDFYNATMKGWKYAFDNIEETAQTYL
jgi:hypothetical protein